MMNESPTPNDRQGILALIEQSKGGDIRAFGELVRMFRVRAYGLALSILKNPQDAEDISQEAFVQAFKKLYTFTDTGSFSAWLLKIVANRSKNKLRWRRIRERLTFSLDSSISVNEDGEELTMQVADVKPGSDPTVPLDQSLKKKRLEKALARLPHQQRTAVHLKFIQGNKITEVAKIMDLSEGTVKSHIFRAIHSLKKLIGDGINEL